MTTTQHVAEAAPSRPRLWRVTDRATFRALRTRGQRGRRGPVSVTWLPGPDGAAPPRVACAVGRAAGGAVARNRTRRRLRSAALELRRVDRLPGGTYLLAGTPAAGDLPFDDLVEALGAAVATATGVA